MEVSKLLLRYQEGQRDFRQVSLRNVNLAQAQLAFINLDQADLWGINFREAQLAGANLVRVDLSNAVLVGANLLGASLLSARLVRANLEGALLSGADLRATNLKQANLRNASCVGIDLSGADLREANLTDINLKDANLRGANLLNAKWDRADLEGAQLDGAIMPSGEYVVPEEEEQAKGTASRGGQGGSGRASSIDELNFPTLEERLEDKFLRSLQSEAAETPPGRQQTAQPLFGDVEIDRSQPLNPSPSDIPVPAVPAGLGSDWGANISLSERIKSKLQAQNQYLFRRAVSQAYGNRCAITGNQIQVVLKAVSITEEVETGKDHPSNGILLRSDLAILFQEHLITLDPKTKTVLLAPSLRESDYKVWSGKPVTLPEKESERPNQALLQQHQGACRWLQVEQTARQLRTNPEPAQPATPTLWRSALRNLLGRNKSAETNPEFQATPAPVNPAAAPANSAPSVPDSVAQTPAAQAPVASNEDIPTGWLGPAQPPSLRPEAADVAAPIQWFGSLNVEDDRAVEPPIEADPIEPIAPLNPSYSAEPEPEPLTDAAGKTVLDPLETLVRSRQELGLGEEEVAEPKASDPIASGDPAYDPHPYFNAQAYADYGYVAVGTEHAQTQETATDRSDDAQGYGEPSYEPGYPSEDVQGYEPGYEPSYTDEDAQGYEPGHEAGYEPSYTGEDTQGYEPGYPSEDVQGYEPGYGAGYEPSYEPGYPDPSRSEDSAGTPIASEPSRTIINPWEVETNDDTDDNAVFLTPAPAIPSEADWSVPPEPGAAEEATPWAAEFNQGIETPAIVDASAWEADLSAAASSAVTNASGSDRAAPFLTPPSIAPELAFVTDLASPDPNVLTAVEAEVSLGFPSSFGDVLLEGEEQQGATIEAGAGEVAIEPDREEAIEAEPQATTPEDRIPLEPGPESEESSTAATLTSFPGEDEAPAIVEAPEPLATEEPVAAAKPLEAPPALEEPAQPQAPGQEPDQEPDRATPADTLASAADPIAADPIAADPVAADPVAADPVAAAPAPAKLPLPLTVALIAIAAIVATLGGLAAFGVLSFDQIGQSSPADSTARGTAAATPSASPDAIATEPDPPTPNSRNTAAVAPTAEAADLTATLEDGTILLQPAAAAAFWEMQEAARTAGISLYPLQGYLPPAAETAYWQSQEAALAATNLETLTSLSNYRSGYGIDIGDYNQADRDQVPSFRDTQAFAWLAENAEDYGFVPWTAAVALDSVDRPWHWHYNPDLAAPSE
ncbi:MAG: pentapeptide repeat-containing protein [Prochlorothrix sp.]|nr:pentapeptide repeat-containing protein [Prochlorothrix sp.]